MDSSSFTTRRPSFRPSQVRLERSTTPNLAGAVSGLQTFTGSSGTVRLRSVGRRPPRASNLHRFVWNGGRGSRRPPRSRRFKPSQVRLERITNTISVGSNATLQTFTGSSGTSRVPVGKCPNCGLQTFTGSSGTVVEPQRAVQFAELQTFTGSSGTRITMPTQVNDTELQTFTGSSGTRLELHCGGVGPRFKPSQVRLELAVRMRDRVADVASNLHRFVWNSSSARRPHGSCPSFKPSQVRLERAGSAAASRRRRRFKPSQVRLERAPRPRRGT